MFGVDLHWLPHAHGSVEIAKIVKRHHPDTPVIFGGLSSTYFHEELAGYDCVDFVMRGDSTEEPIRQLLEVLKGDGDLSEVPNLTWKDATRRRDGQPAVVGPGRHGRRSRSTTPST